MPKEWKKPKPTEGAAPAPPTRRRRLPAIGRRANDCRSRHLSRPGSRGHRGSASQGRASPWMPGLRSTGRGLALAGANISVLRRARGSNHAPTRSASRCPPRWTTARRGPRGRDAPHGSCPGAVLHRWPRQGRSPWPRASRNGIASGPQARSRIKEV